MAMKMVHPSHPPLDGATRSILSLDVILAESRSCYRGGDNGKESCISANGTYHGACRFFAASGMTTTATAGHASVFPPHSKTAGVAAGLTAGAARGRGTQEVKKDDGGASLSPSVVTTADHLPPSSSKRPMTTLRSRRRRQRVRCASMPAQLWEETMALGGNRNKVDDDGINRVLPIAGDANDKKDPRDVPSRRFQPSHPAIVEPRSPSSVFPEEKKAAMENANASAGKPTAVLSADSVAATAPAAIAQEDTHCSLNNYDKERLPPAPQRSSPLRDALLDEDWFEVEHLLTVRPDLARQQMDFTIQSERTTALPLHAAVAVAASASAPSNDDMVLSIIEALVAIHPASVLECDSRRGCTPLHLALMLNSDHTRPNQEKVENEARRSGNTNLLSLYSSDAVAQYLMRCHPRAAFVQDEDKNLPLHYAASFGSDEVIAALLELNPLACREPNVDGKTPLHLLVSRPFDGSGGGDGDHRDSVAATSARRLLACHPAAARMSDKRGRLPLHAACGSSLHPLPGVIEALLDAFPDAAHRRDDRGLRPVDLLRANWRRSGGGKVQGPRDDAALKALQRSRPHRHWRPFSSSREKQTRPMKEAMEDDNDRDPRWLRMRYGQRASWPVTTKRPHRRIGFHFR